ncbi:MAG: creatininase family protein, partial [Caulobacteraceae bacterium]
MDTRTTPMGDGAADRRNVADRLIPVLAIVLVFVSAVWGCVPAKARAPAAAPGSVFLEDLTWTELRALIAAGKTTILVPVGGVEQSGPYLALGKHDARVRVLAERIARKLGNALVAPVVAYVPEGTIDPPTQHMRFPGTITVPPEV